MKKVTLVLFAVALVAGLCIAGNAETMKCDICQPMMDTPGLMQNMKWSTNEIATGMVSIATVNPAFEKKYAEVHAAMMQNVEKVETAESPELCPFCAGMTELAKSGAKIENVDGGGAHLTVVTSQDPAVIAKIHAHARMAAEMAKQMEAGGHGHEGHGHDHDGHGHKH